MRKLIVTEFVSLDGVMEAPGGEPGYVHTGWVAALFDDDLGSYKGAEQLATQTLVLGRTTYESFAGAWPGREGAMADKINTMEKVVLSTTIDEPGWENVTVARSLDEVVARKNGEGGDIIVVGSRSVAQALLLAGAVDELHLQVFPLVLGSGRRLFPEGPNTLELELESSTMTANGVMLQEYLVRN